MPIYRAGLKTALRKVQAAMEAENPETKMGDARRLQALLATR